MKFYHLLSVLIIVVSVNTFSQWEVLNPSLLVDNSFVVYADSTNCSVLTESGNIVNSTDRGKTWKYTYSDKYMRVTNASFSDQYNGWVASGSSSFQTTDGGVSWIDRGNVLEFANWDFYFKDSKNGWAVGNYFIKHTTDGGDSWSTDTVNYNSRLSFLSHSGDSVIYAGGNFFIYKSSDNGASWNKMPDIPDYRFYRNMIWGSKDSISVGFLLLNSSKISMTLDGGENWEIIHPDNINNTVRKISFSDGKLVAFSNSMKFTTTDLGKTWDSLNIPLHSYNTFYPVENNILYLSGDVGVLLGSFDGGKSFTNFSTSKLTLANPEGVFGNISMVDSNIGYINVGNLFKTLDGCRSFTNITPPGFPESLGKVYGFSDNIAAANSDISIFATKNGGISWNVSTYGLPNKQVPQEIYFRDSINWIAGCYWNLMRISSDGGNTWTNRFFGDTSQIHISSISFVDSITGFFTASEKLFKTSNGGKDWYVYKDPFMGKVKFIDNLNGVAGVYNPLSYTTDGGNTWNTCEHIESAQGYDIKKNGSGSVLMCFRYDSLFISYDLGKTWQQKENLPFANLYSFSMTDPSTAWFLGFNGGIVKYHNNLIPTTVEDNTVVVNDFILFQNYPNPFNPATKINFYIPNQLFVELKVFDLLGREIATIVNETKQPGNYEVTFDGNNFASGVYFYQLKAGEFSETKKFILLK